MGSPKDYEVGAAALKGVLESQIQQLPGWEQGLVPQGILDQITGAGSKAVIDAVDVARATPNADASADQGTGDQS